MKKFLMFLISLLLLLPTTSYNYATTENTSRLLKSVKIHYTHNTDTLRIMTYNLLSHEIGFDGIFSEERLTDTIQIINALNPDVLCLQETSIDCYEALKSRTFLQFASPISSFLSRSMTIMMYNPTRLTLLKCGSNAYRYSTNPRLRNYIWAIFQEKTTNELFIVINTHLNLYQQATAYPILQAEELLKFCHDIQAKYEFPVIIAGDFNSYQAESQDNSAVYDYITLFSEDTKNKAITKSCGEDKSIYSPITDHIFCTDGVNVLSYTLLSHPQLNTVSDHYPVFVDLRFNTP